MSETDMGMGLGGDTADGEAQSEEWAYPVSGRQQAIYNSTTGIVDEFGKFDQTSGPDGSHYSAVSPFQADGLVCASCLFYDGARSCEVVAGDIAPEGICKWWVIPADLVGTRAVKEVGVEVRDAFQKDSKGNERLWVKLESRAVEQADDGTTRLAGMASVFGQKAFVRLPDGRRAAEEVAPHAFNNTLNRQDIMLLWQHDPSTPLARTGAGNLTLRTTPQGLEYEATLPNTQAARDAAELVRTGVVNKMSFGFTVPNGGDTITEQRDGTLLRRLNEVQLREVSLVTWPAYEGTSAAVRSDAFGLLCRSLGLNEGDVLDRLADGDALPGRAVDTLKASPLLLRGEPGAVTTSDDDDRAETTVRAEIPSSVLLDALKYGLTSRSLGDPPNGALRPAAAD